MRSFAAILIGLIMITFSYVKTNEPKLEYMFEIKSFNMFSECIDDTFVIDVSLPESYYKEPERKYHVLFLTDGNWRKDQHQPIHDMASKENIEEMIIVGIGYPASYNFNNIRVRDLINHPDRFLDFILQKIIPRIDSEYRTNGERTLWGSSFGGFFTVYTLLNYVEKTKGIFENYIVASAAILEKTNYKDEKLNLIDIEKRLNTNTKELKTNLYITVGQAEDNVRFITPFKELVKILNERKYKDFYMKSFIDPGKDHYTVWEPTLYKGIRLFLQK